MNADLGTLSHVTNSLSGMGEMKTSVDKEMGHFIHLNPTYLFTY